jgi:hypothetical protein
MFVLPDDETGTCCKTRASGVEKVASNIGSIEDAQLYAIGETCLVTGYQSNLATRSLDPFHHRRTHE